MQTKNAGTGKMTKQHISRLEAPHRKKIDSRRQGFSIPTILCIGVVACLWMLGTAAIVIPSAGRITRERVCDLSRSSAEAGLDWAVSQLNDPTRRSSIDHQTVNIPAAVLALNSLSGTVTVGDFPAPTSSYLYDQTCDWDRSSWNPAATGASNSIYGGNGWRLLTATVSAGSTVRKVRVVLKPVYTTTTQSSWVAGTATPFFAWALASGQGINDSGNIVTDSYLSNPGAPQPTSGFNDTDGDIVTNGVVVIDGNTVIGGDINAYSGSTGSVELGPNALIKHNLLTNGTAIGNLGAVTGNYTENAGAATANIPPAPIPPSTATPVTLALTGNDTTTLTNGSYVTSTINVTGNGQLNVNSTSGPVDVYVNGSGSSAGITIGGNGVHHPGRPVDFRIWYSGSGNVQIGGNNPFCGTIYAPNSAVKFNGNGPIYGGVVGSTLTINGNPQFHYDTALRAQGPMYFPPLMVNKEADVINYYQAVSWYEY